METIEYLYEIIEDYKTTESNEEKDEIFDRFCSYIWGCENKRLVWKSHISFHIPEKYLNTDIGQTFKQYSELECMSYRSKCKATDWASLIRQKINNLYTIYFDDNVIVDKEYFKILNMPKRLYYRWIRGEEFTNDYVKKELKKIMRDAEECKEQNKLNKMFLPWKDYRDLINEYLRKIMSRCKLIEDVESKSDVVRINDNENEDNFYVKYFCKSLNGEILKYQKIYYGVPDHKRYYRCKLCGTLVAYKSATDHTSKYCNDCKIVKRAEVYRRYNQKRKKKVTTEPKKEITLDMQG